MEFEGICSLCTNIHEDTLQVHLTSSCIKTEINRKIYKRNIKKIDNNISYNQYRGLNNTNKLIWTMTNGTKSKPIDQSYKLRIYEGSSVTEGVDKDNHLYIIFYALEEFRAIYNKIPHNNIIIYTDGSKTDERVGSGAVIYRNGTILSQLSKRLSNCENNTAE